MNTIEKLLIMKFCVFGDAQGACLVEIRIVFGHIAGGAEDGAHLAAA